MLPARSDHRPIGGKNRHAGDTPRGAPPASNEEAISQSDNRPIEIAAI
jgi:hypothetical protein